MRNVIVILTVLLLAACNRGGPVGQPFTVIGTDEVLVQPRRPLAIPAVLTLPQPTPGGRNLADPD